MTASAVSDDPKRDAAGARARLLQPQVLSELSSLSLAARAAVEGTLIGLHRSTGFGFSQEFAEYRAYEEGDDPRFIDWNVYARTERAVVKRFRGETNCPLMLLLDASASMGFGAAPLTKFRYAQILAASLAYLAARQHDAVGLIVFDETVRGFRAPSTRSGQLPALLQQIEHTVPARRTDYRSAIERFRAQGRRRGMVALLTDFYCEPAALIEQVRPLALQGSDLLLFHLLDPQELRPRFAEAVELEDLESGERVEVSTRYLQQRYPAKLQQHLQALREASAAIGADYVLLDTSLSMAVPLRNYLSFRERRR